MAPQIGQRTAALWFRYLQLAQRMNRSIDWNFYAEWGTPQDLVGESFNSWWKTRGRQLFERSDDQKLKVVASDSVVTVTIPVSYTVRQLRRELGPAVVPYLRKAHQSPVGKFAITGLVRYRQIALYQRLLEIDLAASSQSKPMREKLELLQERYGKNISRLQKQAETIAKKSGGRKPGKRFELPRRFVSAVRLGYQWRRKGRAIVANVARGVFPGHAYRYATRSSGRVLNRSPEAEPRGSKDQ